MEKLINKYAELIVKIGVNVQKDQLVVIRSSVETKELARALNKQAYLVGAKRVIIEWNDAYAGRDTYEYASLDTLTTIPNYTIERAKYLVDNNACFISITSPISGINEGLDSKKMQQAMIASQKAMGFMSAHMMANKTQWVVVGAPNKVWAKKVFPKLNEEEAYNKLWEAILSASRVTADNDPIKEWQAHNEYLYGNNEKLNNYNFEKLTFTNSLGTNLEVGLVKDHVWAGGGEISGKGVLFNPNIPTEESFTMPDKFKTNGIVYATKPLDYQGKLIDEFFLEFKDGKVINFGAKKEEDALKQLIEADEGSSYLGEVALISDNSPINNTNILFYNTLYDENASCHLALGKSYAMNIKGGTEMTPEELVRNNANHSLVHVDFMFGSKDMKIVGTTYDGKEVLVFKEGNFVL